jgi:hypothetical protein
MQHKYYIAKSDGPILAAAAVGTGGADLNR